MENQKKKKKFLLFLLFKCKTHQSTQLWGIREWNSSCLGETWRTQVGGDQEYWENWRRWVSLWLVLTEPPPDDCEGGKELVKDFCTCRHVPLYPWAFREMSSRGFHPTSTWVLTWIINWAGVPTQVLCTRRDRADGSLPEGWGHTIRGVPPHLWRPSLTPCWH